MKWLNILLIALLVVLGVAIAAYGFMSQRGLTISFSEAELEQRLQQYLPYQKRVGAVVKLGFDQPNIDFDADAGRISIAMQVDLEVIRIVQRDGVLQVSGVPSYRADEGAFYLDKIEIDQLKFDGLSKKYADLASGSVTSLISVFYKDKPLYQLKEQQKKQYLAKLVLREIIIEGDQLVAKLGVPK